MTSMKIDILPSFWENINTLQKTAFVSLYARGLIKLFLLERHYLFPNTTIECITFNNYNAYSYINLPGNFKLAILVHVKENDLRFSTLVYLYQGDKIVKASNIGYAKKMFYYKTFTTYEDLLAEIITVTNWARQGHIVVEN